MWISTERGVEGRVAGRGCSSQPVVEIPNDDVGFVSEGSELISLIESDGWVQVRVTGSHRQFHHPTKLDRHHRG